MLGADRHPPSGPGLTWRPIAATMAGVSDATRTDLKPTRRVEVEEIPTAPAVFTNTVELAITPEQLFEVLADADAWPQWAKAITKVTWTSPGADRGEIGVGTTRTVEMQGGIVGEEEFVDWDPPRTMSFYFTATNAPGMEAFAEYYQVVPTAQGCRLTWTLALWPTGIQKVSLKIFGPVLDRTFAWFLKRLRRYTDQRFA